MDGSSGWRLTGLDDERSGSALTQPETWARLTLQGPAGHRARDVDAGMHDASGTRLEREEVVERRDAVRLSRRDGEAAAHVVEPTAADPANAVLQRVERWEQQVSALTVRACDP